MPTIGIRELSRNTAKIIEEAQRTRRPYIVTRNGEPVVMLYAFDQEALEDLILQSEPPFMRRPAAADDEESPTLHPSFQRLQELARLPIEERHRALREAKVRVDRDETDAWDMPPVDED